MLTAHGTIESAVQAMKNGAFYYLTKPTDREALVMTVGKAAELANLKQENQILRTQMEGKLQVEGIIGQDPSIQEIIHIVRKVAPSNSTVLIQGESGTGKEVIARAIHRLSPRAARPFVAINCSAIPDTLIENELFGHERGAFTGATERKIGLIESADKSTLFLDEIGDLGFGMQAKLLRVLQEREVRRVGGNDSFRVDVRLIAATNRDAGRGGRRRTLPRRPLLSHQRRHDYAAAVTRPPSPIFRCSPTIRWSVSVIWPMAGSRKSAARRWKCCSITRGRATCASSSPPSNARSCCAKAIGSCRAICRRRFWRGSRLREIERSRGGDRFEIPGEGINFEHFERDLIMQAMERADWVIAKAAKMLGMSYRTLQYRLDKFGIKRADGRAAGPPDAQA